MKLFITKSGYSFGIRYRWYLTHAGTEVGTNFAATIWGAKRAAKKAKKKYLDRTKNEVVYEGEI